MEASLIEIFLEDPAVILPPVWLKVDFDFSGRGLAVSLDCWDDLDCWVCGVNLPLKIAS